jgi:hypothetical protein
LVECHFTFLTARDRTSAQVATSLRVVWRCGETPTGGTVLVFKLRKP